MITFVPDPAWKLGDDDEDDYFDSLDWDCEKQKDPDEPDLEEALNRWEHRTNEL